MVRRELAKQCVRVYQLCTFKEFKLNHKQTKIQKVTFIFETKPLEIDCAGLFWFDEKNIHDINVACKYVLFINY